MLFVKHLCPLPPNYGGVTVYVKRLMLSFCKRKLYSGAFWGNKKEGIPAELFSLVDTMPKHLRSYNVIPELPRLLYIFSKYQIIHSHTSLSTCFCVWIAHKILKKPLVYTIHNQMIDNEFDAMNRFDLSCLRSLAKDPYVQFITVNENSKIMLKKKISCFANDIITIPPYIPPVEFGCPNDYLSPELVSFAQSKGKTILFYAECFRDYNGRDLYGTDIVIDLYIQLKAVFSDLRLIFCISNVSKSDTRLLILQKKILVKKYTSDVYWQIGPVSEMWPLLKSSTILLRPTNTDGDSVMIREALAYGLPVITSNVTVRPEGCVTFDINNFQELYQVTKKFLANPYRKVYPQVDFTDKMIEIYNNLLKQ